MKIRPLHDRVVVKRLEEEAKTAGGILLPDNATEKPSRGEVIAVGPGKVQDNGEVRPIGVKVGDKVVFGQYGGSTVKIDGEELLILSENEIFGILQK
jgi:chaperonin GroES